MAGAVLRPTDWDRQMWQVKAGRGLVVLIAAGAYWEGCQRASVAVAMPLAARRMTAEMHHCLIEGERFALALIRLGGQTILQVLQGQLHCLARDLARVAVRVRLQEAILPLFVAVLQLAGVELQRRKQLPALPEFLAHLGSLFQHF